MHRVEYLDSPGWTPASLVDRLAVLRDNQLGGGHDQGAALGLDLRKQGARIR